MQRITAPKIHLGYTLIELLIIIAIIALVVGFGMSGYARSQERQTVQAAKEKILSTLQEAQKNAYVGDKSCSGAITGIYVAITSSTSSITTQAQCTGGNELAVTTPVSGVTFASSTSFTFKPLQEGINFTTGTSANVDYTISGVTYRVAVTSPGIITYVGQISP